MHTETRRLSDTNETRTVAEIANPVLRHAFAEAGRDVPLRIVFWDESRFETDPGQEPDAALRLKDPSGLLQIIREPNQLGLGRAWATGALECEGDLAIALQALEPLSGIRLRVRDRLGAARAIWRILGRSALKRPPLPASEAHVGGRRFGRSRAKAAIEHHYDVPSSFYEIVLGPTMVYSCGYFREPGESIDEAQRRKLDRICRKLQLRPGDRFLDIGCGWGSLVLHAATHYGVHAVGITLSGGQAAYASERIRRGGLEDRCEVRVQDYRDLDDGPYDAIASVGMYEHIGRDQVDVYSAAVRELLTAGGAFLNHGIVRQDERPVARKRFIDRFVFPDGELHPLETLLGSLRAVGLEVRDTEALREHYGLTLRAWLSNLAEHREQAIAIAGAERERIWRLYMSGSALAFERGELSVVQTLAVRAGAPHRLPLDRERLLAGTRNRTDTGVATTSGASRAPDREGQRTALSRRPETQIDRRSGPHGGQTPRE